jgi:hypothetical protein
MRLVQQTHRHPQGQQVTTDESTIPEDLRAFLTREIPRYEAQELADDDAVFAVVQAWREEGL